MILSREEIKSKLYLIASDQGFNTSPVLDLIISLMSTSYYDTVLSSINILNESNSETAANINSLINLSAERMSSVYRGTNTKIKIYGKSNQYQNVKRGQLLYEGDKFNVYALKDVEIIPNSNQNYLTEIECIVSTKYYEVTNTDRSLSYYREFPYKDLSEDYIIKNELGIQKSSTKDFNIHVLNSDVAHNINSEVIPYFDLTISDYGLRLYFKNEVDSTLTLSIFTYYNLEDITELDKVALNLDDFDENKSRRVITKGISRDSFDLIRNRYKSQIDTLGVVRSKSDLIDLFIKYFNNKVLNVNFKNESVALGRHKIIYYYIIKGNSNPPTITEVNDYKNKFSPYFIDCDVEVVEATKVELVMNITIATEDQLTAKENITKYMNQYLNKFEVSIDTNKVRTDISKFTEIHNVTELMINNLNPLQINEYYKLIINISYRDV